MPFHAGNSLGLSGVSSGGPLQAPPCSLSAPASLPGLRIYFSVSASLGYEHHDCTEDALHIFLASGTNPCVGYVHLLKNICDTSFSTAEPEPTNNHF